MDYIDQEARAQRAAQFSEKMTPQEYDEHYFIVTDGNYSERIDYTEDAKDAFDKTVANRDEETQCITLVKCCSTQKDEVVDVWPDWGYLTKLIDKK